MSTTIRSRPGVLYGYTRKDMLQEGEGMDDGWCLLGIAQHMLQVEQGVARQFEFF